MKTLNLRNAVFLLTILLMAGFSSCSKDEKEGGSSDLVGTWVMVKEEINDGGHLHNYTYDVSEEEEKMTLKGDGTFNADYLTGRYSYSDGWITITYKDDEGDNKSPKFKVLSLTSSELVWDSWAYNNYTDGSFAKSTFKKIQ